MRYDATESCTRKGAKSSKMLSNNAVKEIIKNLPELVKKAMGSFTPDCEIGKCQEVAKTRDIFFPPNLKELFRNPEYVNRKEAGIIL